MGGGRVHWENNTPPMSMPTPKLDNKLNVVGCAWVQDTLLESMIFSSCLNSWNLASSKGFMIISARLSCVLMYLSLISPHLMWSQMKWYRISICFVLKCCTGLREILMALSLSHQRGTLSQMTPYSFKVCLIHKSCAQQLPAATYSALVDERDTQFCFLEDQLTKEQPRNWHPPEVDFLSTLSPAQSESVYPSSLKFAPLGYHKPKFGVWAKYGKIRLTAT